MTARDHLRAVVHEVPSALPELIGPPLPPLAARAWSAYLELDRTRSVGMHSAGPITFAEIEAYDRMAGVGLTPLDVHLIRVADDAFMTEVAERLRPTTTPPELP